MQAYAPHLYAHYGKALNALLAVADRSLKMNFVGDVFAPPHLTYSFMQRSARSVFRRAECGDTIARL